jgi:ABC-2 type transport system permease protein
VQVERAGQPPRPGPPSFFQHLVLLWQLRLTIGFNRSDGRHRWFSIVAFVFSASPSVALALTFYRFMQHPVVVGSDAWGDFLVRLLLFVTSATWVTWPVLSAGVDDHSELSRYSAFPISSFRLMLASTLASLFEPRTFVFYGPLVGATVGYLKNRPPESWLLVLLGFASYVLLNAALSRVGLHVMLNLLRQARSAELIGGGFVLSLVVAAFIPAVDTEWLLHLNEVGAAAVPDTIIENAALALGRFPTGWFGHLLRANWAGRLDLAASDALGTLELSLVALVVAWGLLLQFHRFSGRAGSISNQARASNPFAHTKSTFSTLVVREALDLWNNPRARLLASVPFVLAILLKLLSGRALFVFLLGASADAWVMGGLTVYGAIVLSSTFSQNAFAYDGHGFTVFLASPVPVGDVLRAKNVVHGAVGGVMGVLVVVFYVAYFRAGGGLDVVCALLSVVALVPVLLTAGNFLSLAFPVKFHANLKRRDKLPFAASMLGLAAASIGTAPFATAMKLVGKQGPNVMTALLIVFSAVLAWAIYWLTLPLVLRWLEQRRELILRAVTRE